MDKEVSLTTIPEEGWDTEKALGQLAQMKEGDIDWRGGRTWSMVYFLSDEHLATLKKAHEQFFSENVINPFAFNSVRRMSRELVKMSANLMHGDEETVGTLTSGGTESIFMAIYTYRERARKKGRMKGQLEIIVPASIHPAFYKAAHILGLTVREIPLCEDLRADPAAMEAAIGPNTLCLAASAPAYPFGTVDPLPELNDIALRHKLPLHVDACVGGFMLPWVEKLGKPMPVWDFRLKGVTSISADLHKFGYGEKGASLVLYRSMDYLKYQFFIQTEWCGGIYVSPSFTGTRSAGPIAAAWTAMHTLGQNGYLAAAAEVMDITRRMTEGLNEMPEILIMGKPNMNLLAFGTHDNKPDIFVVADQLEKKGWLVDRQKEPPSIHHTIMKHNGPVLEEYLKDVRDAVEFAKQNPAATAKGNAAIYGLMARIPFRGMVEDNVRKVFEDLYAADAEGKDEMAPAPAWHGWLNRALMAWGSFRKKPRNNL